MAGLRDTLARFLKPTSLEEVYLAKYGGRYPSLAENVGAGAGSALKAIGAPEGFAETQGRNVADLLGWSPFGVLTAAEETGQAFDAGDYGGAAVAALGAIPGPAGKGAKTAAKVGREALAEVVGKGTVGMKAAEPLAHGRIAQRMPTSPKSTEDPLTDNLLINMDVLRSEPAKLKQASDIIGTYPNTTREMMEMNPEERVNAARDHMVENLLYLYDRMPPEQRARSGQWYLGANKITGDRASEIGVPHTASAGAYAAQSPQKDWYQNVYLGDQVLRGLDADPKMNTDMMRLAETLPAYKPEDMERLQSVMGQRLLNMDPREQALVMRLWDETQGPRQYRKITPEGEYGDLVLTKSGQPGKPAWGTFGDIEKALRSAQSGGDMSEISSLMGGKHKVRNFYNNIIAPIEGRPFGDITADTHQIAASMFRPLSGNSPEVLQGLQSGSGGIATPPVSALTGMRGLYPIYADATRQAAALRGEPVHSMQSIPWEGIRTLYPAQFKTASNQATVDDIWRTFGRGEISAEEARRRSVEIAGGYRPPSW